MHSAPYRMSSRDSLRALSAGFSLSVQNQNHKGPLPVPKPMGCSSRCLSTAMGTRTRGIMYLQVARR
jgi:hypothetical protein